MAQFDVYINPSKKSSEAYPYIVDIQHSLLRDISSRIVVPLGRHSHFGHQELDIFTPIIKYKEEKFIFLTPQIASMPSNLLLNPIGTIESLRNEIIAAIDLAITGI